MRLEKTAKAIIVLTAATTLVGCEQSAPTKITRLVITSSPELVMAGFDDSRMISIPHHCSQSYEAAGAIFAGRNDDRLGSWPGDQVESVQYLEVQHREYLRTINGQPNDYSVTQTIAIKRGVVQ